MQRDEPTRPVHAVSVVVPVYRAAEALRRLVEELIPMCECSITPSGARYRVSEILLVHDCGPGRSDEVIRSLSAEHSVVRGVWLSRNFGQHAATLAGMASSGGDWICSLDEDGQHDPAFIPNMLDTALAEQAAVVYADPQNSPPHSAFRNATSKMAKWVFTSLLSSEGRAGYHSYRLVLGEIGRSLAAYSGRGIYLDVALGWITQSFATCPVVLRRESETGSGYSTRRLASHFWRLVLTSGTRPMRVLSVLGAMFASLGLIGALLVVIGRVSGRIEVEGWSSLAVITMVGFGLVLFSLGIVAEYVGVAARMAMGQPPYLIVSDMRDGPLGDGSSGDPSGGVDTAGAEGR